MKKAITVLHYYINYQFRSLLIKVLGKDYYINRAKKYSRYTICSVEDISKTIFDLIIEGKPFCVARFGATELFCASMFEFDVGKKKNKAIQQLMQWSGFFPADISLGDRFNEIIIESCKDIDILGFWNLRFEDYYIKQYGKIDCKLTYLYNLEPWQFSEKPWSTALKNKKVLLIHPFVDSIKNQYQRREKIYPNTEILPDFELYTLKAVQTVAGEEDDRFKTWFEALNWMHTEAMKIDFDVAIIGCGAYGLPLASMLKRSGKQAIHLGGATQLLFGIRGRRWDEDKDKEYIRRFYNSYWVYPSDSEKPKEASKVENGCYWK